MGGVGEGRRYLIWAFVFRRALSIPSYSVMRSRQLLFHAGNETAFVVDPSTSSEML